MTTALVHLVDYWRRYHAIKIGIAAALLAVLVALTVSRVRRNGAVSSAVTAACVLLALLLVVVNVQATAAPLSALLQGLPMPDSPDAAQVYREMHQALTADRPAPVLDAMIDSLGRYHAVLAIETAVLATVFVACSGWAWRARARRRIRTVGIAAGLLAVGLTAATVVGARLSLDAAALLPAYFSAV